MSYPHHNKITDRELNELLSLRKKGWTYESLAFLYGVDHSSIYHLCKKHGAEPETHKVVFNLPGVIATTQFDTTAVLDLIIRHKPSCYAEYILTMK